MTTRVYIAFGVAALGLIMSVVIYRGARSRIDNSEPITLEILDTGTFYQSSAANKTHGVAKVRYIHPQTKKVVEGEVTLTVSGGKALKVGQTVEGFHYDDGQKAYPLLASQANMNPYGHLPFTLGLFLLGLGAGIFFLRR